MNAARESDKRRNANVWLKLILHILFQASLLIAYCSPGISIVNRPMRAALVSRWRPRALNAFVLTLASLILHQAQSNFP